MGQCFNADMPGLKASFVDTDKTSLGHVYVIIFIETKVTEGMSTAAKKGTHMLEY